MALDLGNAQDFATATLSGASSILNQFAGLSNETWDIQESAYGHPPNNLVLFHVFKTPENYDAAVDEVQDNISRRVAVFGFPYVDGQTTEDLGKNGSTYDFNILIHGPNYYAAYLALLDEFDNPVPGTLVHPVYGQLTVKFEKATVTHRSDKRKAIALRATFIDHTFEVSFDESNPTTKSALANAVGFISKIAGVLTDIQSNENVLSQIKSILTNKTQSYQTAYLQALVSLNTTFNLGSSSDIPGLVATNPGNASAFPSAESPTDPLSNIDPSQVQALASPVLSANQAIDMVSALRTQTLTLVEAIEGANSGQGALIFYADVLTIKQSAIAMQQVLELGLQTSNNTIVNYTTPRLMSVREVCFAVGLSPDDSQGIITLNPLILSANYIPANTLLQVPSS